MRTKFDFRIALPVLEILGGILKKFGQFHGYAHAAFSPNFLSFIQMDSLNVPAKFEVRSL